MPQFGYTPKGLVLVVGENYQPHFPCAWLRTCEETIHRLNEPIFELWLHTDVRSAIENLSLIDYLVELAQAGWENRPSIVTIVIFHEDDHVSRAAAEQIAIQLRPHYSVRLEPITPAQFTKVEEYRGP